ncbi:hypothetical protein QL285_078581 [Trifolium repens]|nr:hypothetical protein QL285_078581 [Trifolium repens]
MGGGKGKKKNSAWVGKYRFLVKSWADGVKSEFFVVDLKKEMIVTKHPEAVWSGDDFESTAVLHKGILSVLNLGVINAKNVVKTPEQQCYTHSSDSNTCISTLDLTKTPFIWSNWTPGPKMIFKRYSPYCAVLDKMIFAYRAAHSNSRNPEVYQIGGGVNDNKWEETAIIPFDPAFIAGPPISDPNNNRLIAFFHNSRSLYAYYLNKNYWEVLHQPLSGLYFFSSASAAANQVVGDNLILYFYRDEPQIFMAYNIFTNKWLDVDWLFEFNHTQQMYLRRGTKLVHLGNDILCLVTTPFEHHIHFFRFSVKLVQEPQLVQLTPLSYHSIFVPDVLCITNTFIPF